MNSTKHYDNGSYKFNFSQRAKEGYTNVIYNDADGVSLYNSSIGYGFLEETSAHPPRKVHTAQIISTEVGFEISEPEFYVDPEGPQDNYNNYGMAFRIDVPVGTYNIYVKITSETENTIISVSGMDGNKILKDGFWDSAALVPIKNMALIKQREWTYKYVNGQNFIDIEIEPKELNTPVGVEEIIITPIQPEELSEGNLPTIFTLGDSTVKSYIFNEAPMSSWGQVFDDFFDLRQVNVINYSMGGRSFKNSYAEGRFNDALLTGKIGDYILVQFGHNDEREDEYTRFGRGSTETTYEYYIRNIYIPAIRSRGMIPILVTPMSRVNGNAKPGDVYTNSFKNRRFPDIMKATGEALGITVIDLNRESIKYYNEIGVEGTTAIFMSIEAGETPGKTNDGSYANGHPSNKIDGTHYKEALAKQFARIVITELNKKAEEGDHRAAAIVSYLNKEVKSAIRSGDWTKVFSEIAKDIITGQGAYYRNQIEKLIQLGIFNKDQNNQFNPDKYITVDEYRNAMMKIMKLDRSIFSSYEEGILTREVMGAIIWDAYNARYKEKPKYMTDYNGKTITPDDPEYDPNLDSDAKGIMYYPIVSYEQLEDTNDVSPEFVDKIKKAYDLGLIRSENGIIRGKVKNGTRFNPKGKVLRGKAAKTLYYMWVLIHPVNIENDVSYIE